MSPEEEAIKVKALNVDLVKTEEVEPVYANYLFVRHTPYEFILTFGRIIPPEDKSVEELETVEAKTVSQVIVSHEIFAGMVDAIQKNLEKFERKRQALAKIETEG
jgi:hypothetical protein